MKNKLTISALFALLMTFSPVSAAVEAVAQDDAPITLVDLGRQAFVTCEKAVDGLDENAIFKNMGSNMQLMLFGGKVKSLIAQVTLQTVRNEQCAVGAEVIQELTATAMPIFKDLVAKTLKLDDVVAVKFWEKHEAPMKNAVEEWLTGRLTHASALNTLKLLSHTHCRPFLNIVVNQLSSNLPAEIQNELTKLRENIIQSVS